ncbi:hypothetical protein E2C01_008771 [Portunus trituberculatus]|uniref:Uncharacterized protein n=1 Tax=Portunus trituberculatus TaxID=210409 RepID=A0A5B7D3U3_PORTR|nr:hypothetical protein [Portunus trituberculatus]
MFLFTFHFRNVLPEAKEQQGQPLLIISTHTHTHTHTVRTSPLFSEKRGKRRRLSLVVGWWRYGTV